MNLSSMNPIPIQPSNGTGAPDQQSTSPAGHASFSEVLSDELEHGRNSALTPEPNRVDADSTSAQSHGMTAAVESAGSDALADVLLKDAELGADLALPVDIIAVPDTQAFHTTPDAVLARAIEIERLHLTPTANDSTPTELGSDSGLRVPVSDVEPIKQNETPLARNGPAPSFVAVNAFAEQLLAVRHAGATHTAEVVPDAVPNPAFVGAAPASMAPADVLSAASANKLAPSVGTAAWHQALGEKIVWMAAGAQQSATLTLNPPTLGPLQIVLNLNHDQASASFFTAQAEVRHALETAFPRLREMMNEAGITLGHASVSAEMPGRHSSPEREGHWDGLPYDRDEIAEASSASPVGMKTRVGLVDTFA